MNILITGATGFIGSHIARAVQQAGHNVVGCVRNVALGEQLNPALRYIPCDFTHDTSPELWLPRLAGVDVVINVVGIITESGQNRFQAVHTDVPCAMFDACKTAGVRVIQISALGVSADAHTAYNDTKMAADRYLLSLGIPAVVLRPSWLYGERSRSFELLCAFSALPIIPVVGKGEYRIQPIFIEDFAHAVAALVTDCCHDGQIVEAGGPDKLTIAEAHQAFRWWLGRGKAPLLNMPEWFVKRFVKIGDYVFKGPINTASFDMLTRHNITDDTRLWQTTKVAPRSLREVLSAAPSLPAHRQYAALFFLLPLLRYSLAFLWLATAIITGFFTPRAETFSLFAEAGVTGGTAKLLFYSSLILDFWMGIVLLCNHRVQRYGKWQLAIVLFYTGFITLFSPHWWLHPYGAILKNIPILAATLLLVAASERKR